MPVMQGFAIGQYYPGDSVIHRADPRVKLLLVLFFALTVFFVDNFTGFAFAFILLGITVAFSKLPVGMTLKGIRPLLYILVFTFLIHLWTGGGPWIDVGPVYISGPGLVTGTFVSLRLVLLIIGASFLTLTTTPVELTDAIESLLSPLRRIGVPAHELAMMMSIALRFIPTLSSEAEKVVKAQVARGARFDSRNPAARAKSFIPILIPLLVGIFRRADELAEAMESRAYRGGEDRTRMRELKMRAGDWMGLLAMLLLFAGMVVIGRMQVI